MAQHISDFFNQRLSCSFNSKNIKHFNNRVWQSSCMINIVDSKNLSKCNTISLNQPVVFLRFFIFSSSFIILSIIDFLCVDFRDFRESFKSKINWYFLFKLFQDGQLLKIITIINLESKSDNLLKIVYIRVHNIDGLLELLFDLWSNIFNGDSVPSQGFWIEFHSQNPWRPFIFFMLILIHISGNVVQINHILINTA